MTRLGPKTIDETEGGKPMSDLQAIADRVEIEALRGEFTDAGMLRDFDRFASLFTQDAVWRIPVVDVEFVGREVIRAGIERLGEGLWEYLVQTTHPGTIQLEGDTASGRAYVLSSGTCATAARI
jgi:ketosteroid isomerase-like protein